MSRLNGYTQRLWPAARKWLACILVLAGLALLCAALVGISVRTTIDPSAIEEAQANGGENAYAIDLRHWSMFLRSDEPGAPEASKLQLFEDGHPLGPAHSIHTDIAALGEGRYSHWSGSITFSSTDNSDPRTNGRTYSYAASLQLPSEFLLVGVLCLFAALWPSRQRISAHLPLVISASFLLVAISLLWLFNLLIETRQDIAQDEILTIIGFCLLVMTFQVFVIFLFPRYVAFLFPLFGVINVYSLYFVFSSDVTTYPFIIQFLLLLSIGALYFTLLQLVLRFTRWRGWVMGGATLGVIIVGVAGVAPIVAGPSSDRTDATEFPGVRVVEFTRHPNVYFLGFDALTPKSLANKLLDIEQPPYIDVISKHGGKIIPNLFADQVMTRWFWATIMNIIPSQTLNVDAIVLGIEPSPVLATFQHNGYDTHASFWNAYFGPNKGPFLTSYAVSEPYSTCSFLGDFPKRYGLLGYCMLREANWLFPTISTKEHIDVWNEFYLERLRSVMRGARSKPYFFASHYPQPGHTPPRYRNTESEFLRWREDYLKHSKTTADIMNEMLMEIRISDPTAIVFVFGDHGSLISQGMNYADDPEFIVQDRHGIMGAVFGAEACILYLQPPEGEEIQTASRVVAGILQCLAGGESPLVVNHDFGRIHQAPNNMRFEDYAYE